MTPRDVYAPDIAKAFGIVLVVFGHVLIGLFTAGLLEPTSFWENVRDGIYLFHMPLFFYLSGLFFQKSIAHHGYGGLMQKNVQALLLPLVIWSYLQLSLQYLAGANANNRPELTEVLMAPVPPQQQFWFLGALFVIMAVVGLVYKSKSPRIYLYVLSVLFLFNFMCWKDMVEWMSTSKYIFFFGQIILHIPYFVMGILLGQEKLGRVRLHPVLCVVLFVGALWFYLSFTALPSLIFGICSILCILSVYKLAEYSAEFLSKHSTRTLKAVCFVGMNSMIIYLAHVIVAAGVRTILLKSGTTAEVLYLVLPTVAGLVLPLLAVPVGIQLQNKWPKLTAAVLPVRVERKIS